MKEPIRVKTIDLDRKGGTYIKVLNSGEVNEDVPIEISHLSKHLEYNSLEDNVSQPALLYSIGYNDYGDPYIQWRIECEFWKESTEAYESRVLREKQLNDMYNYKVQTLMQELNKAQSKIRQLEGE